MRDRLTGSIRLFVLVLAASLQCQNSPVYGQIDNQSIGPEEVEDGSANSPSTASPSYPQNPQYPQYPPLSPTQMDGPRPAQPSYSTPGYANIEPIVPETYYNQPTGRMPLQGRADVSVQQMEPPVFRQMPPYALPEPSSSQFLPGYAEQSQNSGSADNNQTNLPPLSKQKAQEGLLGGALKTLLSGGVKKNVPPAEQPWWIPGRAFTNDSMVAPYHNMDIFWWDKRPMPPRSQWIRLSSSVTRFWRGYVAEPCMVFVEPCPQAPGNFTFRPRQPNGPRGWLQALSEADPNGFPQYRYWLDQAQPGW